MKKIRILVVDDESVVREGVVAILSYQWDFKDKSGTDISTDVNPAFIYNEAGLFTVTLTASSAACVGSIEKQVRIHPNPVGSVTGESFVCRQASELYKPEHYYKREWTGRTSASRPR